MLTTGRFGGTWGDRLRTGCVGGEVSERKANRIQGGLRKAGIPYDTNRREKKELNKGRGKERQGKKEGRETCIKKNNQDLHQVVRHLRTWARKGETKRSKERRGGKGNGDEVTGAD